MMKKTIYYRRSDGALGTRTIEQSHGDKVSIPLPDGASELSAEEYTQEAARRAAAAARRAEDAAEAATTEQREAYEALIAAGLPEGPARRISGWRGDPEDEAAS
ncbi:hypothetical protein [Streptomyces sulphureus]|uniref:hypothetical protein n=1 Tax=Streptomyces sulphureus TaxID=47758 RepID=UPI000382981A|nr:hypothetical protein [Streptomyces sulphureus]